MRLHRQRWTDKSLINYGKFPPNAVFSGIPQRTVAAINILDNFVENLKLVEIKRQKMRITLTKWMIVTIIGKGDRAREEINDDDNVNNLAI